MQYKSKYIILDLICATPVVFSDFLQHSDVARGLGGKVMGAGFCFLNEDGHYVCYGKSVSLGVESDAERDSKILNKYLGVIYE